MPLDAVFLTACADELRARAVGCKIDKIQQPERDLLLLHLRGPGGGGKLLLSASPNHPRIHFTEHAPESPAQPPMFCMLLRKHLLGGRLVSIDQPPAERLLSLLFACTDELGQSCEKRLILELTGRGANLILTGPDGRILDCLRRVDLEASAQRQLLPGLFYHLPAVQDKREPFSVREDELAAMLRTAPEGAGADRWLLEHFRGLSPLLCRELSCAVFGGADAPLPAMAETAAQRLYDALQALSGAKKQPVLLLRDGQRWDFTCIPVAQYGDYVRCEYASDFSSLLDDFYSERERDERIRQKTQTLRRLLSNQHSRTLRRLETQKKELAATQDRERLRRLGDIVTANLYAIGRGQARLTAVDFYDPEMKMIDIPLNPALSPQQNAAKFYKDYQKAKNAEKVLRVQIEKGEQEAAYLSSVLDALSRAERARDVEEIRQELAEGGYLKQTGGKKQMKLPPSRPMRFRSSEGFAIYVGRNNRQNDLLTCKLAAKNDVWLHTQKIHGSHVIIETGGRQPSDQTVTEAM